MIRFILRAISLVALVVAVMAGTIDAIQSVSASEPVLTPLAVAWSTASPDTIALVADGIMRKFPYALHYRVVGETVSVLACLHFRQSPDLWPGA